jgi:hypothetical protein
MSKVILKKHLSDNIGRLFNLAFNQMIMYSVYHKSAVSALERFYRFLTDGFRVADDIALSLNQDVLFVEEEPLDSRINTSRLAAHMKKAEVQSINFAAGIDLGDLTQFFEVFTDLRRYRNADAMKKAFEKKGLQKVAVNYFIYAKIKTDETVIHSSQAAKGHGGGGEKGTPTAEDILTIMATDILSEELQKNLSIQNLMRGPSDFSSMLISADIAASNNAAAGTGVQAGTTLVQSLGRFQKEVKQVLDGKTDINLSELAEDVFELKQQLLRGIEAQKAKGIVYLDEQKIRKEADAITDGVLVKLIIEEYQQGAVSVERLAQITLRLVSNPQEFQRILPKLKRALLASGMSLLDFLQFVQEIKNELQSEELTSVLERSAEEIGLEGEDLIQEIMANPNDAAEFIYLASEIRKSGEDARGLSDLMVNYIDRVGSELTMAEMNQSEAVSGEKINGAFAKIRSEIVAKLKQRDMGSDVLSNLEKRLMERMEESLRQLKSTMVFKKVGADGSGQPSKENILRLLQTHAKDDRELREVLAQVKSTLAERGIDTSEFEKIYAELERQPAEKKEAESKAAPPGSLNKASTLFVLEKEILRANRYDTPFSILSFSIVKATPKRAVKRGSVSTDDVIAAFVAQLIDICRETDLTGMLGAKMIVVLQPMTDAANAKLSLVRITKELKLREFIVKEIPFEIIFASVVTPYDSERTPDMKTFVRLAQTELKNIADRIVNIQSMI